MREITVSAWDDVHLTEDGQRVPADPASAAVLVLDGQSVELDLTPEHRAELEQDLARWFKAGAKPDLGKPSWKRSPRQQQPIHAEGLTPMQAARRYNAAMFAWANEVDPDRVKYKITNRPDERLPGERSKPFYPMNLREDFAAHLARQAGSAQGERVS